jgi:hypothetical protein
MNKSKQVRVMAVKEVIDTNNSKRKKLKDAIIAK